MSLLSKRVAARYLRAENLTPPAVAAPGGGAMKMKNVVNKLSYDEAQIVAEGFDGDQGRFDAAMEELDQLCTEKGINMPDRKPGAMWLSSTPEAFAELKQIFQDSTDERPDDDTDLLMAYLAGAKVDEVTSNEWEETEGESHDYQTR